MLIGVGALRVRGLLLAVSTFAFALAASQYLYRRPILSGDFGTSVPFQRTKELGLDLRDQRTFYYVVLGGPRRGGRRRRLAPPDRRRPHDDRRA